jgi:hypothetical protein
MYVCRYFTKGQIKVTVQRDFLLPFFFIKLPIMVSQDILESYFEFCRIFVGLFVLKGIVLRDFRPLVFFHASNLPSPLFHNPKPFRIQLRFLRDIRIRISFCVVAHSAESIFFSRLGSISRMDGIGLG